MNNSHAADHPAELFTAAKPGLLRWRYAKDRMATVGVTIGGLSVILAVVLIFFYLLWVVLPLFKPASMEVEHEYPARDETLLYAVEEQAELALRVQRDGSLDFFDLDSGQSRLRRELGVPLVAVTELDAGAGRLAALDVNGQVHLIRHRYRLDYPEGEARTITPRLTYPFGDVPITVGKGQQLAARGDENTLTLAVADRRGLSLRRLEKSTSFLDDSVSLESFAEASLQAPRVLDQLLMDPLQQWLYGINYASGQLFYYDIRRLPEVQLLQTVELTVGSAPVTAATMLAGGISLVTAGGDGRLQQWFPLRDPQGNYTLHQIRGFAAPSASPVTALLAEHNRRTFIALDAAGHIGVYYATSEREVLTRSIAGAELVGGTIAPRADHLLLADADGGIHVARLHNEHPEVSWKALWGKIWYESYPEPDHVWQSSSASSDHEPKFSLAPLSFGTLKAAFYAMLFAIPLAIAGAIYTAYFMSAQMRQMVKPTIEIMEALPTVILGFLAGLWLAPFIENFLPGTLLLILLVPFSMPLGGWLWSRAPAGLRYAVPDGWEPALLIVPVLIACAIALLLSQPVEAALFGGSMPHWLDTQMGISYDQRNSLVVGLAMGFAVIPTIFSITEDAIFSVPKHLTQGSLALGASRWQTLVRVVLPTASPGMFSGLMIGLGRAVGETMIVLMATGNTPIMDMNIFEGFRTLSANIAVEMPESEVGSTHYRILFLAGLVLFMFTFVVNTLAEIVRQRLRGKYSSL